MTEHWFDIYYRSYWFIVAGWNIKYRDKTKINFIIHVYAGDIKIICTNLLKDNGRGYMNSINIYENKTLKLQNVIVLRLDLESDDQNLFDSEINKISTYIQTHGANQIGPLIQYSKVELDENNEPDINMQFMLQANNFIHNVEQPYRMESLLRVKNCLYARYNGPEDKLKFAYDKLGVYAFENDIELDGCNYTIYVDRNEEEETMVADVFMPVKG